ncbi:MAG: SRPBCC family protein [Nitrososphaerales archaeon]
MRVEVCYVVRAPREKVYAAYTDFESMPKWSRQVTAVRVVGRKDDTVYIESEVSSGGRSRPSSAKLTLSPPEWVETESEARFTKARRTVRFKEVLEGTKVTAVLDVSVKGLWAWVFAPRSMESAEASAQEGLAAFARYVENLP